MKVHITPILYGYILLNPKMEFSVRDCVEILAMYRITAKFRDVHSVLAKLARKGKLQSNREDMTTPLFGAKLKHGDYNGIRYEHGQVVK